MPAKLAHITITSDPAGAEVFDAAGTRLGTTPTEVGLPADGAEHTFTLRHPQTRERSKTITATGDTSVEVILERLPRGGKGDGKGSGKGTGKGSGKGTGKAKGGGDIMDPAFLEKIDM
ncbi:MAG: PEGA domain-containing protein [Myxococcales bacterium]|nr:PEGA domain-containing protein [Myxococcales bacterium]